MDDSLDKSSAEKKKIKKHKATAKCPLMNTHADMETCSSTPSRLPGAGNITTVAGNVNTSPML